MRRALRPTVADRSPGRRQLVFWLLAALVAPGCHKEPGTDYSSASEPPTVRLVHPSVRNIVRVVGQPSFIEAYERTSIYPKLTGYIEKQRPKTGLEPSRVVLYPFAQHSV